MRRFGSRCLKPLCLLLGIAALAGCGKKGPLYRPDAAATPDRIAVLAVAPTAAPSTKK
jgi:predicted small lipoprotein YifL